MGDETFLLTWERMKPETKKLAEELYACAQASGIISKKTKKLILLAIATSQRDGCSCRCYARGAKELGATKEECFEAVQLALELAGIGAVAEGIDALDDVFGR